MSYGIYALGAVLVVAAIASGRKFLGLSKPEDELKDIFGDVTPDAEKSPAKEEKAPQPEQVAEEQVSDPHEEAVDQKDDPVASIQVMIKGKVYNYTTPFKSAKVQTLLFDSFTKSGFIGSVTFELPSDDQVNVVIDDTGPSFPKYHAAMRRVPEFVRTA